MKRFLIRAIFVVAFLLSVLGGALFIPSVQEWARAETAALASKISGKQVTIGHVGGAPPLFFSFSDVAARENETVLFSAKRISFIPAWFDLIVGHSSLLHLHIDGARVNVPPQFSREKTESPPLASLLPGRHIHIYSFSCTDITLDRNYSLKGHFLWNPGRQHLACTIHGEEVPTARRMPQSACLSINAREKGISLSISANLPEYSFEGAKGLTVDLQAASAHPYFLEKMWGKTKPPSKPVPYIQGGLTLWTILPNVGPTRASGSFTADSAANVTFAISKIHADSNLIDGNLEGQIENKNQEYILTLKSRTFSSERFQFENIDARIAAKEDLSHGTLKIKGQLSHLPLQIAADWATDRKTHLAFTGCRGRFAGTELASSLDFLFSPCLVKGNMEITSRDIAPLADLFGASLRGSGKANIALATHIQSDAISQEFQGTVELSKFHGLSFGFNTVSVQASGSAFGPDHALTIQLKCEKGHAKHIELAALEAQCELNTKKQKTPFEIKALGKTDSGRFELASCGSIGGETTIEKFDFALEERTARLAHPIHIKYGREFTIEPFELLWNDDGYLRAFAHMAADSNEFSFCCRKIPTELIDFWLPSYQLLGTFSGEGEILTKENTLFANVSLKSEAFTVSGSQAERICPLIGELEIHASHESARLAGQIKSKAGPNPLFWNVEVPLKFCQKPFSIAIDTEKPILGRASGSCDITPFFTPFLKEDEAVEGILSIDASLSGTISKPQFAGTFSWHDGKLDVLKTGGILSHINLEGKFSQDRLNICTLSAQDADVGQVAACGFIEFSMKRHFPFSLEIEAKDMEVIHRDFASGRASGNITFAGDFTHASILGAALVTGFDLNLASDFSSDLALPEFIFINTEKEEEPSAEENPFVLNFDLELDSPKDCIHVEGRGLSSNWKGHIRLLGPHDALNLYGALIATSGKFLFASKEFILKQGSCEFAGDPLSQSRLNACVGCELSQMNIDLNLRGMLRKPALTFTSTPPASQKEILSWILFSKPLAEISAVEGLEIASVLMELQYGKTRNSPIDVLKRSLGIDRIDVTKSQSATPGAPSDEVQVGVGKYLSKDVLLRLSKDVASAANRVALEANLHKNFSVEAEVGDDQEGEMSLKFKHDY